MVVVFDLLLCVFMWDVGVDVFIFGGIKNGVMFGEVIVVLNLDVVDGL